MFPVIILAGIFWGLASLTRSVLYPFTPLVAYFLFLIWPRKKEGLLASLLFLVTVILTLSPWIIRNYRVFGHFVAVDTMGGLNLYMGNYEYTPLHRAWAAVDNPPEIAWYRGHEKELAKLNEAEKQRWAIKQALRFIKEHPGLTTLRSLIKLANFWQLERTIIAGIQKNYFPGLKNKFFIVFLALCILGSYIFVAISGFTGLFSCLICKTEKNNEASHIFLLLVLFYFTTIHALVFGHSRYHLPLVPILCLYTSYFLLSFPLKGISQNKKCFFRILLLVILVFFSFWFYDVWIGSREKIEIFLERIFL